MSGPERFAYSVSRIEDLTAPVRVALDSCMLPGEEVRKIIFAPRQTQITPGLRWTSWFSGLLSWRHTPDWVLVLSDRRLILATIPSAPEPVEVAATDLTDLLWVELGTVLLHSWFEWAGTPGHGPTQQRVYFNTVRDDLFWQMLVAIRCAIIAQSDLPEIYGERDFTPFKGLPYKFENLIPHRLLLPGEQTQARVYQPAIWGRRLGPFRRQRAPACVVVLTPQHLLVAKDAPSSLGSTYGLIARYCPRRRLRDVALHQTGEDLWLSVTLDAANPEVRLTFLFEPAAEPDLRHLLAHLASARTRQP